MPTPAEHRTTALATLNRPANLVRPDLADLLVSEVHALLATKAGTGTDYTTAETLLDTFTLAPWSINLVHEARARATLAT